MRLAHLEISNFRNISSAIINTDAHFVAFWGENGSGKTSLLEAIYLLGTGRSFRSHINSRIVQHEKESLLVHGKLNNELCLGIEKQSSGKTKIHIQAEEQQTATSLAKHLPVILVNSDGYRLLEEGPVIRRQFLDWGGFHVKPSFVDSWRQYKRALQQRNTVLREKAPARLIKTWDPELIVTGQQLDYLRKEYVESFLPVFYKKASDLFGQESLSLTVEYHRGWPKDVAFEEVLDRNFQRDCALGYTSNGPHRADLKIKIGNIPAVDVLSRGQQKLLICALRLSQGEVLYRLTDKTSVFLIDDLAAELDSFRRKQILDILQQLDAQIFITSITREMMDDILGLSNTLEFHVKRGSISRPND